MISNKQEEQKLPNPYQIENICNKFNQKNIYLDRILLKDNGQDGKLFKGEYLKYIMFPKWQSFMQSEEKIDSMEGICAQLNNWRPFSLILGYDYRQNSNPIPRGVFLEQKAKNKLIQCFTNLTILLRQGGNKQIQFTLKLNKQAFFYFIPVYQLLQQNGLYRGIEDLFVVEILYKPNLARDYYCFTSSINADHLYSCKQEVINNKHVQSKCRFVKNSLLQADFIKSVLKTRNKSGIADQRQEMDRHVLMLEQQHSQEKVPTETEHCMINLIYSQDEKKLSKVQDMLKKLCKVSVKNCNGILKVEYDQTTQPILRYIKQILANDNSNICLIGVSRVIRIEEVEPKQLVQDLREYLENMKMDSQFVNRPAGLGGTLLMFRSLRAASWAGIYLHSRKWDPQYQHNFIKWSFK